MPSLTGEPSGVEHEHLVRSSTRPTQDPADQATGAGAHVWLSSLVGERWKLIIDHNMGRSMLFDLLSDPGETNDRFDEMPQIGAELRNALQRTNAAIETTRTGPSESAPSEEHLRRLRALGYL